MVVCQELVQRRVLVVCQMLVACRAVRHLVARSHLLAAVVIQAVLCLRGNKSVC